MMRALTCVTIVAVLAVFLVPWAGAGELSQDYLAGRWVIDSQSCNSMESEYIEFRKDGTYVSGRGGKSEIVGFWNLEDDILKLHMLTSPAFFDDIHGALADFENKYQYLPARMVIFNAKKDSLEAIGLLGDVIKRAKAVRCK